MPLIQLDRISKQYPSAADQPVPQALDEITLNIEQGEFVAIMGPSGSGKSTLMNLLGCLDTPSDGHYHLDGRDVTTLDPDELALVRNQTIGFVFQGFNLLKRISALDNVALPLLYSNISKSDRRSRAQAVLELTGLGRYLHSLPNRMSGGQQQRVAIARALINQPRLILADEPTGNLDTHTSREIMDIFAKLNREQGITIVLVTHENDIARYAQRLIRIVDGHVVEDKRQVGTTNEHE
ncbi:MAG: ABC transporter ATP-binding protein [Burkholderiales bacterium]|nr:ABC transporter ATP-binding protein [Burkholderiales bacterium]